MERNTGLSFRRHTKRHDFWADIDYVKALIGVEHIGIAGDFDGMPPGPGPVGLDDVAAYPNLFRELIARRYSDEELRKIAGGNFLRAFSEVERVSEQLRTTTLPGNTAPADAD